MVRKRSNNLSCELWLRQIMSNINHVVFTVQIEGR